MLGEPTFSAKRIAIGGMLGMTAMVEVAATLARRRMVAVCRLGGS